LVLRERLIQASFNLSIQWVDLKPSPTQIYLISKGETFSRAWVDYYAFNILKFIHNGRSETSSDDKCTSFLETTWVPTLICSWLVGQLHLAVGVREFFTHGLAMSRPKSPNCRLSSLTRVLMIIKPAMWYTVRLPNLGNLLDPTVED
jgi:hypothetical protein